MQRAAAQEAKAADPVRVGVRVGHGVGHSVSVLVCLYCVLL